MAQTGYTPILIYSSSTGGNTPAAGNLTNSTLGSELAINITDGKLFYKDNANAVQVIGWKTVPTTAGGTGLTSYTAGDLIYYASGTTFTKLGIGSAYQALQVNAGATAPSWQPSATSVLTTQGDLLYASAANTLARLGKNTTATRYLANTGSNNNPAWDQINLSNGVTGTLGTTNGGTGLTSFTANGIVYASSTSVLATSSALTFDGTNFVTTGSITPSQTGGIIGTTTNNNANAGSVGEYVSASVASTSRVSLSSGITTSITTISLTAGDWDVQGNIWLDSTSASTTYTVFNAGISTGSASSSVANQYSSVIPNSTLVNAYNQNLITPVVRLSLSGTTTVYLATLVTWTTGTVTGYGQIRARRVR